MTPSPTTRVQQAIQKLRQLHQIGRDSLRQRPGKAPHGDKIAQDEARERGLNLETFRKARVFADPEQGWSHAELNELCRILKEHHYALGLAHLVRLLSVPKEEGQRDRLLQEAVAGHWSTSRLEAEIRKRFGRRKAGGRKPYVAADVDSVYAQLESFCEKWRRWHKHFQEQENGAALPDLPRLVRQRIKEAEQALQALQTVIVEELERSRSGGESPSREGMTQRPGAEPG